MWEAGDRVRKAPVWAKVVVPALLVLMLVGAVALARGPNSDDPAPREESPRAQQTGDGQPEGQTPPERRLARSDPKPKRARERNRESKRTARQELVAEAAATSPRLSVSDETLDRLGEASCPASYVGATAPPGQPDEQVARALRGNFGVLDGETTRLVAPVNWHMDPFESVKFQGKLQGMSWLEPLFRAYRQGDRGALRQARELVLDWVEENRRRGQRLPPKAWGDKVAGDRAPRIAFLTQAASCEGFLSNRQARQLLASVQTHARFLADPLNHPPSNHGLFVDLGLARLVRQLPFMQNADAWGELAAKRFQRTLRRRIVEDEGFWLEHSANYQVVMIGLIKNFIAASGRDESLKSLLKRMRGVAGWLTMPDEELVLLGDTNQRPIGDAVLNRSRSAEGLLWLPRSGLAVVRQQQPPAYLSTAATFFSGVHKHSDELTFDLYDRGHRIVSDSGNYAKDPGLWRDFSRSAAAHSVLTVDGQNFSRERERAYGSGLTAAGEGSGWSAVLGTNPLLRREGVRHRRLILYRPGFAALIVDQLRSDRSHEYRRYFQLGDEIAAKPRGPVVALNAKGFAGGLRSSASTPQRRQLLTASNDPPTAYLFPDFRTKVPRTTVTYRTVGKDVDHVAAFGLHGRGAVAAKLVEGTPKRTIVDVQVEGGRSYELVVERDGKSLSVSRQQAE